jgi:hypothetical protein
MTAAAALADKVERLRPDWRDPAAFLAAREELARELRLLGVPRSPAVIRTETRVDPALQQRVRRLAALAEANACEVDRLRRLIASQRPPSRRRPHPDARQLGLPLEMA